MVTHLVLIIKVPNIAFNRFSLLSPDLHSNVVIDYEGYLMFTDDWEPDGDYTTYFQPGTPARAHRYGAAPYRLPPFIPTLSNYQLDILPYRTCCKYAEHCEFYYWRRMTNGCQDYRAPAAGYMYGEPHVITYDGIRYTMPGKGYYVLTMSDNPYHKLMVQVRLEQPDDTLWHAHVNATVITGIAVQENDSSIVQVYARKPMRRWRYRTDVYVDGSRRFFDKAHWKHQQFKHLDIRNPLQNMNQSEIVIMLKSGVGIRIFEGFGMLDVMVTLPPSYNSTCQQGESMSSALNTPTGQRRCYTTLGLLGVYNNDPTDDLTTPTGSATRVQNPTTTSSTTQMIYEQFASTCKCFMELKSYVAISRYYPSLKVLPLVSSCVLLFYVFRRSQWDPCGTFRDG
uniref:Uncharacterized protein n=1 Tax=Caenorhabditis japonica TaxID=281687 RepID=A0A8R1IM95_CAEJA